MAKKANDGIEWINPIYGIITSSMGERTNPVRGVSEFHDGTDIAADIGTEVMAVKPGIVTDIYSSDTFGNVLIYRTDDGYVIKYAHLDKITVKEGQSVKQSDVVAYSGNSGLTTGAHLHYSLYYEGEYTDPFSYLNLPYIAAVQNEYAERGLETPNQYNPKSFYASN